MPVYKQDIVVDKSIHEIMDFMNKTTFHTDVLKIIVSTTVSGD